MNPPRLRNQESRAEGLARSRAAQDQRVAGTRLGTPLPLIVEIEAVEARGDCRQCRDRLAPGRLCLGPTFRHPVERCEVGEILG